MPINDGRQIDDRDQARPVAGFSDAVIPIDDAETPSITIDAETGAVSVEHDDGSVEIDLDGEGEKTKEASDDFDENLCDFLDESELSTIATEVLEGIESDLQSRSQWEKNVADSMVQLGLQRETKSKVDMDTISKCRHPILLECSLDFWANFVAEFLPAEGPVKVRVDDDETDPNAQDEADRLETDLNHYLTVTATEYYPDTSRAGFRIGFIGGIIKKVFRCALRERPVSEAVYLEDLIVSNEATDLPNAKRKTQRMMYLTQDVKAMQVAGVWRDVELGTPEDDFGAVKSKIAEIQGTTPTSDRIEDKQHTIYECHTKRVIDKDKKAQERIDKGLPVPYKITLDKDGRTVLAIYRLWKENDKLFRERQQFVPWFYAPGLGWYPIGLAQILGNDVTTLTALWREMVDSGMFANFPGFLYLDSLGRQDTNRFKIPPAGGQAIKAPPGMTIQNSVMPLPYKEVSATLLAFAKQIEDAARKKAGAAKIPIGEGKTDIPVGSLLMFVEQSTKMMQAIHKGLHVSQQREFELLKELFVEDPEALTKFNDDPDQQPWTSEQLANHNLVPASDPNTPSHTHRLSVALALFMMAQQSPPGLFNNHEIADRIFKILHVPNTDSLFAPPQPPEPAPAGPPPDPAKMAAVQQKEVDSQRKAAAEAVQAQQKQQEVAQELQNDAANRASQERISQMNNETDRQKLAVDLAKTHMSAQAGLMKSQNPVAPSVVS